MTEKRKAWLQAKAERRRVGAAARVAWTRAYWARVKADPVLYKQHCAKVKEAFLKQRMKGIGFFKPKKKL